MDEQKTNIEITEEPAVDEMAEEVTEEASTQDMSAEAEKYEPILKRKACRKKTEKRDRCRVLYGLGGRRLRLMAFKQVLRR